MKLTKQLKADLAKAYQCALDISILDMKAPLRYINQYIAEDVNGFGTAADEKVTSRTDCRKMVMDSRRQSKAMLFKAKKLTPFKPTFIDETTAHFRDEVVVQLGDKKNKHSLHLWFTTVFKYRNNRWQMVLFHGSMPNLGSSSADTFHVGEAEKKLKELEQVVAERTLELQTKNRELEIETSLERVRARSLAMHHTSELQEVIHTVHRELLNLNIAIDGGSFIAINSDIDKQLRCWGAGGTADTSEEVLLPIYKKPFLTNLINGIKKGTQFFTEEFTRKQKQDFFKFLLKHEPWLKLSAKQKKETLSAPGGYTRSVAVSKHSSIFIISHRGIKFSEAHNDILKRFARVFEQTYTRFLDLQKAEAQAREAQIEAALEKVRSRSLAMHKSDELKEVIRVVLQQFILLNINAEHAGFYIDYKKHDDMHIWLADPNIEPFFAILPYFDTATWNSFQKAKAKGTTFHSDLLDFKEKNKFYRSLFKIFKIPEEAKKFYLECKGLAVSTVLLDNVGLYIENFSAVPYTDEENKILMRFGKVFQQTYTRFLDLQKAEAQAREAQIETSLERIRAAAMAMHSSESILEVTQVLREQIVLLGEKDLESILVHIYEENSNQFEAWYSYRHPEFPEKKIVNSKQFLSWEQTARAKKDKEKYKEQETDYTIIADYKMLNEWYNYLFSVVPEVVHLNNDGSILVPDVLYYNYSKITGGALLLITNSEASDHSKYLLKRAAAVFNLAYSRFLDLQKAEAQAREGQIQLALERVRARTMAMQKSDELLPTAEIMFDQLKLLGAELQGVAFAICDKNSTMVQKWTSIGNFSHPYDIEPGEQRMYDAWKNQSGMYEEVYEGEKQKKYYEKFMEIPEFRKGLQKVIDLGIPIPTWQKNYAVPFKNGYVLFIITKPFDETQIFLRFGNVFEQTYTRFLDLQKAEAQAREAQIEVALERVRTVALSMKRSEEMLDIAQSLYEQLLELGFANIRNAIIDLHNSSNETFIDYDYSPEMGRTVTQMSYYDHPFIEKQVRQTEASSDAFFELILEGKELQDLIDVRLKNGEQDDPRLRTIKQLTYNLYSFGNGSIGISNFGLLSEEHKLVLKRFRNVFAFAYQRYTDMAQAEEQAREAQIEAALERVRSRTLAMQQSEELSETSAVLFKQLIELGIAPNRLFICIVNNGNGDAEFWITDEDGSKVSMAYKNNLNSNPSLKKMFVGWQQQQNSLVIDMKDDELQQYFKYLSSIHVPFKGGLTQKRRLQYLAYFSKGFIGMASPDEQPEETVQLLERFAGVFNLTFTRFNDLKVAEAHALQAEQDLIDIKAARKKAEEALTELQTTQKQLIQSEKMASLGELTAGIAHEIQNPLNFVNNFSEVSAELIDEMKEELSQSNYEDANTIADDLKQNLEKINHHGKRAGDIVKGMLQHSRTSTGQKEMTDINALCDEYLRLAYHGLRAKDKSFNAEMKTDFDESIGNINIVPQDIGRVILNLITNAFYAANEMKKSGIKNYEPLVSISTKKVNDKVEIKVSDNGNGISKNIVDKIFQPFFTTKPTGQGTGLGLSLSYDIVKAHGGELKLETIEGEGSVFVIQLPNV